MTRFPAVQASQQKYSGAAYLSSSSKEPQQRIRHNASSSQYQEAHTTHHHSRSEHPSTAAHSFPAHTTAGIPRSDHEQEQEQEQEQRDPEDLPSPSPRISDDLARNVTRHQYGQDNILQSYDLYIPEPKTEAEADADADADAESSPGYWILYIHGGYFRDRSVTSSSFLPALSRIVASDGHEKSRVHRLGHPHFHLNRNHHTTTRSTDTNTNEKEGVDDISASISGYASINYRLSPHPKSPQDARTTPAYELRNAKWPDHMHDVLAGIAHLQQKHAFGERYLLVGHSVGATMALLSTLASARSFTTASTKNNGTQQRQPEFESPQLLPCIEPPLAVLGVSGIYDFPALHDSFPSYVDLTRNAMDADDDDLASPARYTAEEYTQIWVGANGFGLDDDDDDDDDEAVVVKKEKKKTKKRAVVLAHSRDDGLVDWRQVEVMKGVFCGGNGGDGAGRQVQVQAEEGQGEGRIDVKLVEIHGAHNRIWEDGTELARAIGVAVRVMRTLT